MDVVYVVRPGEVNNELKLSLRCLENNFTDLGEVTIAGYVPSWIKNVRKIEVDQPGSNKYYNVINLIRRISRDSNLDNKFVIMNDDFYILNKISNIPYLYSVKPLAIPTSSPLGRQLDQWNQAKYDTALYLRANGYTDKDYELHTPMVFRKKFLKNTIDIVLSSPILMMYRSIYGNMFEVGGDPVPDVKINRKYDLFKLNISETTFLSSNDFTFANDIRFANLLKEYCNKSRFEK